MDGGTMVRAQMKNRNGNKKTIIGVIKEKKRKVKESREEEGQREGITEEEELRERILKHGNLKSLQRNVCVSKEVSSFG